MQAFANPTPFLLQPSVQASPTCSQSRKIPCMGPWKKGEKDEAFLKQQEILARRRNAKKNKEYFNDVNKRRDDVENFFQDRTLKVELGQDPLEPWKVMKEKGFIDEGGYQEEDEGGIPIPMASFGIPKYDRGARFDLKLPHVEIGYTDPDADIMGKAGNAIKNIFGFGKKKDNNSNSQNKDDSPSS